MARPTKQTVSYFPHAAEHGKTLYILEKKYGKDGYCFFFKLLEILAKADGHYFDGRDEIEWEYFLVKTLVDDNMALNILDQLAKLGKIDSSLWDKRIIWYQKFVDNIAGVYRKRKISPPTKTDVLKLCGISGGRNLVSGGRNPVEIIFPENNEAKNQNNPQNIKNTVKIKKEFPAEETEFPAEETPQKGKITQKNEVSGVSNTQIKLNKIILNNTKENINININTKENFSDAKQEFEIQNHFEDEFIEKEFSDFTEIDSETKEPVPEAPKIEPKIHPLQNYIDENFEYVKKLKKQLTYKNCETLVWEFDKKIIVKKIEDMENTPKISTKYTSFFRTLKNWIEMQLEREAQKGASIENYKGEIKLTKEVGIVDEIAEKYKSLKIGDKNGKSKSIYQQKRELTMEQVLDSIKDAAGTIEEIGNRNK